MLVFIAKTVPCVFCLSDCVSLTVYVSVVVVVVLVCVCEQGLCLSVWGSHQKVLFYDS